jgi:hypothetical protein
MNSMFGKLLALAVVVQLLGCAGTKDGVSSVVSADRKVSHKVECAIEPSKPRFKTGESVLISVVVRNPSDSAVDAAFWGLQKDQPIVNFRVHRPDGKTSVISTKQNLWCGTGIGNTPIPTNRVYKFPVDLLKTWEWGGGATELPPGDYTISAELFSTTQDGGRPKVAESEKATFTVID